MFVYHNLETINGKHNGGKFLQNRAQGKHVSQSVLVTKFPLAMSTGMFL